MYSGLTEAYAPWVLARVKQNTTLVLKRIVCAVSEGVVDIIRGDDCTFAVVDVTLRLCSCGFWVEFGYMRVPACAGLQGCCSLVKTP